MAQVSERLAKHIDRYASYFADFEEQKTVPAPLWVHRLRKSAISRFSERGFPITRELEFPEREEWLYTNVAPIVETPFQKTFDLDTGGVTRDRLAPYTFGQPSWSELVFVDGLYAGSLSRIQDMPAGVRVQHVAQAIADDDSVLRNHLAKYAAIETTGFAALNTAFLHDGAFIHVPEGKTLEHPIHIIYVSTGRDTPTVSHLRTLIVAGAGSLVKVVESYVGLSDARYFSNAVTEIAAAGGSVIEHYRIQRESRAAYHVSLTKLYQEQDSNLSTFNMSMGGALTRNDIQAHLNGEHTVTRMNGLYLVTGNQHIDNHTLIEHAKPSCDSYEVYKGILDGQARAVFNGKVYVHREAQETDAKQLNKNLLLSPDARVNTKPQLEIFADQVKCTHGATVGQLDEEQIFYLITRGMSRDVACNLLTYGFAADLIRRLRVEAIREQLDTLFEETIRTLASIAKL